ncbi:hypothetical protein [Paraburkholderia sp. GAS334]|jgi:hypothetical protein|uniref:hypothetical protein n=1 Tax=unclassified Paraburkholderia TaxID=2615204 RepID=UPI003D1E5BF3
MKRSDRRAGLITATLAALTLGTYGHATFAATDGELSYETRIETTMSRNATTPCEEQASSAKSQLTLLVQPPAGNTLRLTYLPAAGWKLDTPDATPRANQARVTPVGSPRHEENRGISEPMTVFIDGPTGYTYLWIQDQGWKFAGRITDRIQ